jgi:hypothetical protein
MSVGLWFSGLATGLLGITWGSVQLIKVRFSSMPAFRTPRESLLSRTGQAKRRMILEIAFFPSRQFLHPATRPQLCLTICAV